MKIQAISFNSTNTIKNRPKKNEQNTILNTDKVIKNSMSEAIGRSQVVSFSGTNKINGNIFEHTCSEFLGNTEKIVYNKEDGSFVHTISSKDGELKQKREFHPQEQKEILIKYVKDGTISTIKTPNSYITEITKEKDNITYYEVQDYDGNKTEIVTDLNRRRKIYTRENADSKSVQVFDIDKNVMVTSGDLIYDKNYNAATGLYEIKNVITGEIVKQEKYKSNKTLEFEEEYYPKTGEVKKQTYYNDKNGTTKEINYDEDGSITKVKTYSKDKKKIDILIYSQDDENKVISHLREERGINDELKSRITYFKNSNIIEKEEIFNDENNIICEYRLSPNVPKLVKYYNNDKLQKEASYYNDGKTYQYVKKYQDDNSYVENFYSEYGSKSLTKEYSSSGVLYYYIQYDIYTGTPVQSVETDLLTGDKTQTYYHKASKFKKQEEIFDEYGNKKEYTAFYKENDIPQYTEIYNKDGSYTQITYNTNGEIISREEFNRDGSPKVYEENKTKGKEISPEKSKKEQLIDKILDISCSTSKSFNNITGAEWIEFRDILGLDNINELFKMDKTTFRLLSKKFHPDLQQDDTKKEEYAKIFSIINSFYQLNQSK